MAMIISAVTVKSKTIAPPSPTMFQCRDYQIPIHLKCDGLKQCVPDGVDEVDCPAPTTPEMKEILITGRNRYDNRYDDNAPKMEVLDSASSNATTKVCQASTFEYPLDIYAATGALVGNDIVICGGYPAISSCHQLGLDKHWKLMAQMSIPRYASASVSVQNGLWITGGYDDGDNTLKSTETMYLNGSSITGPSLPQPRVGHCMVQYKDTVYIVGGEDENYRPQSTVWLFNVKDGIRFIGSGPQMNHGRADQACGIYHRLDHGGKPLMVVAGGQGSSFTSETWDFSSPGSNWTLSTKNLPTRMGNGPRMTATGDGKSLIMTHQRGVYKLHCKSQENCYWQTEEYQLEISRKYHIMISAPSSLIENCNCKLDSVPCGCKDTVPIDECEQCADGFWGPTDTGCRKCECAEEGISMCNKTTGACECKGPEWSSDKCQVACNVPYRFCCESGVLGDQECKGVCIKEIKINDGNKDCDNGSDEEVIAACDAPRFCCNSGVQGDQECKGRCIKERQINDGNEDCSNRSDETRPCFLC